MKTTQKEVKTKSGEIFPKGSKVTFNQETPHLCLIQGNRLEPYRIRVTSAFKSPSLKTLERQSNDGVCTSVFGETVEPDGWDSYGSPSWLLAMGVI